MKRTLLIGIGLGLALGIGLSRGVVSTAEAQDRTITVREIDVQPRAGLVEVLPDAGVLLTAYCNVVSPSVVPPFTQNRYPFNGARAATAANAILQACKNDLQVGSGAAP